MGLMGTTERPKAQPSPQHKKGQNKFLYFGLKMVPDVITAASGGCLLFDRFFGLRIAKGTH
jgi:hypothetical protein